MIVHKCISFFIEFMIQWYITESTSTSLWTNDEKGVPKYYSINLSEGLYKNLIIPIIIKLDIHNELISLEISYIMDSEGLELLNMKTKDLFVFDQKVINEYDLILVDTNYEFGKDKNGMIWLIDKIHTFDSSHYWIHLLMRIDSKQERILILLIMSSYVLGISLSMILMKMKCCLKYLLNLWIVLWYIKFYELLLQMISTSLFWQILLLNHSFYPSIVCLLL